MRNLSLITLTLVFALIRLLVPSTACGLFYNFDTGLQGWEELNGTVEARDGVLVVSGSDGVAVVPDKDWKGDWADYTVECKMMMETGPDNMGVIIRCASPNTYYIFAIMNGRQQAEFWSRVNGNYTNIENAAFPNELGRWYEVKVVAEGKKFKFYIDGELVIEAEDDSIEKGKPGVRTWSATAHFDDFLVKGKGIPTSPGEPGAAVAPRGKLATLWARLKAR